MPKRHSLMSCSFCTDIISYSKGSQRFGTQDPPPNVKNFQKTTFLNEFKRKNITWQKRRKFKLSYDRISPHLNTSNTPCFWLSVTACYYEFRVVFPHHKLCSFYSHRVGTRKTDVNCQKTHPFCVTTLAS